MNFASFVAGVMVGIPIGAVLMFLVYHFVFPWLAHQVWLRTGGARRSRRRGA